MLLNCFFISFLLSVSCAYSSLWQEYSENVNGSSAFQATPSQGSQGNYHNYEGAEERMIKISNTSLYPYNLIGLVTTKFEGINHKIHTAKGTGFLISPFHVVTTASLMYRHEVRESQEQAVFAGEAKEAFFLPAPPMSSYKGEKIRIKRWYLPERNEAFFRDEDDYALLVLEQPVVVWGSYFQLKAAPSHLSYATISITGCPVSKAWHRREFYEEDYYELWEMRLYIQNVPQSFFTEDIQTLLALLLGEEGAPILLYQEPSTSYVIGLHINSNPGQGFKKFLLFTHKHIEIIDQWIKKSSPPFS